MDRSTFIRGLAPLFADHGQAGRRNASNVVCLDCQRPDDDNDCPGISSYGEGEPSKLPNSPADAGEMFCGVYFDSLEDERVRVGRALHDSTGQLLLSLSLSFAKFRETPHDPDLDAMIEEMSETVSQIAREIRTFSFLEYPAELRSNGLVESLRTFARGFAKRTGLRVDFQCGRLQGVIDPRVSVALLRITQEALVNVHRHSGASAVHLHLIKRADDLELTVEDDGCGIKRSVGKNARHGFGLIGMRHRAERLGGRLDIESVKHGTRLRALIPMMHGAPSRPSANALKRH